jgi:hypothetical protein
MDDQVLVRQTRWGQRHRISLPHHYERGFVKDGIA